MSTSAVSGVDPTTLDTEISVRVEKLAQDQKKAEGEAAVQLIEGAQKPPPSADGKGALLSRYV